MNLADFRANADLYALLRVTWFDFEQGVRGTRAGTVRPLIDTQRERGSAGERSFATLGQNKRPCEKQTKAGPAKHHTESLIKERENRQIHYKS